MKLPKNSTHIISTSELQKNIFRLINLFMGFTAILDDNETFLDSFKSSPLFQQYSNLFEEEFSKLILDIAINTRVLDDLIINSKKGVNLSKFNGSEIIGILDEEEFFSPREAINKIIHSTYIGHDIRNESPKPYYMPSLHLLGKKGKKEWTTEVFLIPFCKVLYDFALKNEKISL
ncbi:conserved hypothetical protein [Tenacibaculum litopenaei]|uniref:hypothetical protein n=1 Tax=Tenacibaculum litopenaei TaxID=396016 RepID=UPI003894FB8C